MSENLETQGLAKKVHQIKRIIEMNELVYIDTLIGDEWVHFRYFVNENDPAPYIIKKIHKDTVLGMDWSLATLLVMNAPNEPNPLHFEALEAPTTGGSGEGGE